VCFLLSPSFPQTTANAPPPRTRLSWSGAVNDVFAGWPLSPMDRYPADVPLPVVVESLARMRVVGRTK